MPFDSDICRACLIQGDEAAESTKKESRDFHILKCIYTELTLIEVADDDNLPNHLCTKCSVLLEQFKSFKETCLESYTSLRKTLNLDIKNENDKFDPTFLLALEQVKLESYLDDDENSVTDGNVSDVISIPVETTRPVKRASRRSNKTPAKEADSGESLSEDEEIPKKPKSKKVQRSAINDSKKRKYKCTEENCNSSFVLKTTLEFHQAVHRGEAFTCDVCDKKIASLKSLLRHRKSHETITEGEAQSKKAKSEKTREYQFKCLVDGCGKSFFVEEFYIAHMRIHKGVDPRTCDICSKELCSVKGMFRHRLTHQTLEERLKENQCHKCYKSFADSYRLRTHMRHHETGKTVICDECGMAFHDNTKLKLHQKSHNPEATFKCELCPKAYRTYNTLYSHKQTAHDSNKAAACLICGKGFTNKRTLYRHRKMIHTVYTTTENIFGCHLCEVKCKDTRQLKEHLRLHTGERKYACKICPKTFAHKELLNRHGYFHSGERPVHCEVCKKGFYTKHALNIHMNIHKRAWIAEGVEGIELFGYGRNKN